MRKLGLAFCIVLVSGMAQAGSIEIPVNGGVGRLHIDESCTDRLCGTASWTDGETGQRFEFALPNVTWKEIEALSGVALPSEARPKAARPEKSRKAAPAPSAPANQSAAAPPAGPSEVARTEPPAKPAAPPSPPSANAEPPAAAAPAPEPKLAAIPPSAPAPVAAAPGPVGLWMTEKQEGMVRVEPCGQAICGYEVNGKTQQNGKKVLIDMRPAGKSWKGRIHDPRGGGTYDSTVSMKGKDAMRVEGCALGGLFCGGQTWTRVN